MSAGNANTTISRPWEPNWHMLWGNGPFRTFQLDIVGFLAVLGESSVTANYQVSALSKLFYLPRLIPAPQALLPARRPTELLSKTAWVTGVYSGNRKEHLHHVAGILLENDMKTFEVRCVEIKKKPPSEMKSYSKLVDTALRGVPQSSFDRTKTHQAPGPPPVKATATGPLALVTVLGFTLSLILFAASITFGDGMSFIATLLLSFLSTLIGAANKWTLELPSRKGPSPTLGDTVIRYPNGSFLVVKCEEDVARELFFAPEEIKYNITNPTVYRMISLVGTIMLMLGVVSLANAKLQLQFAWAGAYILINAAHWAAAAVPPKLHWDLSCYEVEEQSIDGFAARHKTIPEGSERKKIKKTFTEALWEAILVTKSTRWTKAGKAAPQTEVWDQWLIEAETIANTAGNHVGAPLYDLIWAGKDSQKSVIWDAPKDWSPKTAWDDIHRSLQNENTGAPPAQTA